VHECRKFMLHFMVSLSDYTATAKTQTKWSFESMATKPSLA